MIYYTKLPIFVVGELDNRFVKDSIREVPEAKRVEDALLSSNVPVSKGELRDRLPEVSVRTIERVLGQMVRDGRIEKIGSYRDARYRRV